MKRSSRSKAPGKSGSRKRRRRPLWVESLEDRLLLHGSTEHLEDLLPANGGDGSSGFVATGIDAGDQSGYSAKSAGDINGDGVEDLIIGAPSASNIYIVYGSSEGFSATVDLDSLDGTNGLRLVGNSAEQAGFSVSSAGNMNNDGFDDLIIGAPSSDPGNRADAGSIYVVLGSASLPTTLTLSSLNSTNGFRLDGTAAGDRAGTSVSSVGDVNNDGFDDVLVGAPGADPSSRADAGSAYVVLGTGSFAATMELSSLNGANGFRLDGATAGDEFGLSISGAGNVNNDNFDDMLIGAPGADPSGQSAAGSAYVVFGAANFSGATDVSTLNGTSGFRLDGVDADDRAGQSVAGDGDVNGDGFSDVIVGSPRAEVDGVSVGAAYVFLGKSSGFASSISLGGLDGTTGFRLAGDYESDPVLSSFIVNTTGLKSHDIAGQNTSLVENALVNFTSVIPDDDSVYAHSSGIPAEVIGTWPGNPNTVTDQDRTHQIPRLPIEQSNNKTETGMGSTGVWIDGVAIFNWSDGRSYRNQRVWNQNAVHWEGPSLDSCGAHPPLFGEYHTHATPACLMDRAGDDGNKHSPILGWSYDGFPIYGPWGYANADGSGDVERMESSWRVRDITVRTHYADGSNVTDGPTVSAVPLGAYLEDHEYVNNLGDLDRYNGRFSVTPEYPEGVYHYHVTTDTSGVGVFPYVIGIEYYGAVETANTTGQGGNVGDPAAADVFVSYIRDHNGDGFDDPAWGDPDGYASGSQVAGTTHVIYGKSSTFTADTHLHSLDGTNGFHVEGIDDHDHAGYAIGSADVNGDGGNDLIIGAHDADPNSDSAAGETFVIFGTPAQGASPTLDNLGNLSIDEDANQQVVSLTGITAGAGNNQPLRVTATSDNTNLIPNPIITYASAELTGSLAFTPASDASGSAVITVTVEAAGPDGNLDATADNTTTSETFTVTVNPINDIPTLAALLNLTLDEDATEQTVNLVGITAGVSESQLLRITASSDQTGLIPNPAITYTSEESTGTINFTPVADQSGAAEITVTVIDAGLDGIAGNDDDASLSRSFHVTVNPVNDAPVMATLPDLTFQEDIQIHMNGPKMGNYVTDIDSDIGSISYRIANLDTIDSRFGVSIGMASDSGQFSIRTDNSLHIHPVQDFNGQTIVTIEAQDSAAGVSAGQSFLVTITPLNDLPVLSDTTYQTTENTTFIADANHGLLAAATEPDDDDLVIQILTNPSHGQLILGEEGAFSYIPDENYNRTDGFTYRVFDGTGFSNTGMVTFEIATTHPWYNGQEPKDVNNDELVTALDVLWVINEINVTGSHLLSTTRSDGTIEPFLDVNRDGYATPLDALIIINYLNQQVSGEGESTTAPTVTPTMYWSMDQQDSRIQKTQRGDPDAEVLSPSLIRIAFDNMPYWQQTDHTLISIIRPGDRYQSSNDSSSRDELFETLDWLDDPTEDLVL